MLGHVSGEPRVGGGVRREHLASGPQTLVFAFSLICLLSYNVNILNEWNCINLKKIALKIIKSYHKVL